ncbi:MAG: glycosyltransferase family 2 protein [Desulfobacter postgatei]|uniref:glycosyltransferase family 2 protein n=1 Tax=Desulfobacter postgatei TaxID=2293 RepID=UPI0023EFA53B|nr:glycosyltransferase family 2 protein [Desulfobacter postgatei]MDD4274552.1 glycosyltransferase family 2 protein [Desulfobacter postgatei]
MVQTNDPEYSIVIPVYKSSSWMDELVSRIGKVMEQEAPGRFELILVNDCSPDTVTWPAIKRNAQRYTWIRGFNLLYNVGQFRAIMCGLEQACGRFILTMDDDLQHLPEELPKLIHAMQENEDCLCVMGKYKTKQHNTFRNSGSLLYQNILNRVYGKPPGIQTTSFRIMKRELVDALLACRTAKPQISPLIVSITRNIKNVPVRHALRTQGQSGYSVMKLVGTTVDNIIHASTFPLRFFSAVGSICAGLSLFLSAFFFIRWATGGIGVAGFTTQILLITFFGGMMLAGIGVLGEYIARIIMEITGPERYRIKEQTEKSAE